MKEHLATSEFDHNKLNPILYYCWDAISDNNIYVARIDLQNYSEAYSRVVDDYLKTYSNDVRNRDVQPNSLIFARFIKKPNKCKSYALTASGINYVYLHKIADLYCDFCDEFDILINKKKELDVEYREKIRCFAATTGQYKLKKLKLDIKEESLTDKEKENAQKAFSEHGVFEGLSVLGEERLLINDQGRIFKTPYGIIDVLRRKHAENKTPEIKSKSVTLKTNLKGRMLFIDAGTETTVSRESISGFKKSCDSITIGPGIKVLGSAAFAGWDLKQVTFDPKCNGVTVRRHCFENCIYLNRMVWTEMPRFDLYSVHRTDLDDETKSDILKKYPDAL